MKKIVLINGFMGSDSRIMIGHRIDLNLIDSYRIYYMKEKPNNFCVSLKNNKEKELDFYYKTEKEANDVLEFIDYHMDCIKMADTVLEEVYQAN